MRKFVFTLVLLALPVLTFADSVQSVLHDREGNEINVRQCREEGKHMVFVFWQSWCGACKKEAPALVEASHRLAEKAQFIGVVSGSEETIDERKVDRFISATGLDYPQVRDKDLRLTNMFKVKGTPTIIVIDPKGRVVYRDHHAPDDWNALLGT